MIYGEIFVVEEMVERDQQLLSKIIWIKISRMKLLNDMTCTRIWLGLTERIPFYWFLKKYPFLIMHANKMFV